MTQKKAVSTTQETRDRKHRILKALRKMNGVRTTLSGKPGAWLKLNVIGSLPEIIQRAARTAGCDRLPSTTLTAIGDWLLHNGYRAAVKKNNQRGYHHYILLEVAEPPATS